MKERPILFSGPMVQAILGGRKTQTRRVVKTREPLSFLGGRGEEADPGKWGWFFDGPDHHGHMVLARGLNERHDHGCNSIPCPYGQAGDRLWVRETWRTAFSLDDLSPTEIASKAAAAGWAMPWCPIEYEADTHRVNWDAKMWGSSGKTRVSIHMPRWASRLALEVTEVKVDRGSVTPEDARREGFDSPEAFAELYEGINGPGSLATWRWAISFKVLT